MSRKLGGMSRRECPDTRSYFFHCYAGKGVKLLHLILPGTVWQFYRNIITSCPFILVIFIFAKPFLATGMFVFFLCVFFSIRYWIFPFAFFNLVTFREGSCFNGSTYCRYRIIWNNLFLYVLNWKI